jgi:hypothetical protein
MFSVTIMPRKSVWLLPKKKELLCYLDVRTERASAAVSRTILCAHARPTPLRTSPASRKRGRGRQMPSQRREEEETPRRGSRKREKDVTPYLLLKHPDETFATCV